MEKLLHERLRDASRIVNHIRTFDDAVPVIKGADGKDLFCQKEAAKAIADEIERYYIPREQHEAEIKAIVDAQTNGGGYGCYSPHHIMKTYAERSGIPMKKGECITDWMMRYFIERPRFEDGEPVQSGEYFVVDLCNGEEVIADANYMVCALDGSCAYLISDYGGYTEDESYRFKRPTPKVYDADGVEVKVGDTVWNINNGCEHEVISLPRPGCYQAIEIRNVTTGSKGGIDAPMLTHERPVFDAEGVRCKRGETVWDKWGDQHEITLLRPDEELSVQIENGDRYKASDITHREPDSIEKVRDFARANACKIQNASVVIQIANRLTALIERGA